MPFRSTVLLAAALLGSAGLLAGTPKPPQMDPKVLQGWMAQGMPVAEHARLRDYVGTWATHQTDWLPTGKTWNEADGTATYHLTLGGRFVQEDYTAALNGHPFHAMGLMGFDRQAKSYILLWMDDLNTGFMSLAGTFDGTGRVLTLLGALPQGAAGQVAAPGWRVTDTWWDANHHAVVWWGLSSAGQPTKLSQILYTRQLP